MPTHASLTGADLHEPKGVDSAATDLVYVTDGAGSGAFGRVKMAHGWMYSVDTDLVSISGIGITPKKLDAFTTVGTSYNVTPNASTDELTVDEDGIYLVSFNMSFEIVANGDAGDYQFHIRVNGVETGAALMKSMTRDVPTDTVTFSTLANLSSSDVISVWVESDDGSNSDDILISFVDISAHMVSAQ